MRGNACHIAIVVLTLDMLEETKSENNDTLLVDEKSTIEPGLLDEIVKAGILYGRKRSKTHPRMKKYIFTTRNGIEIIDIVQTLALTDKAAEFLKSIAQSGGLILFVGTTPAARETVKAVALKFDYPYVAERWLGGTLTNFKTIHQRTQYYIKLKADRNAGRLEKYTKKERLDFDKEIARLDILFSGLEKLVKLPEVIVVLGATSHDTAINEARRSKVPIVALLSSDADPDFINYPIPANDRAKSSIVWILNKLERAIEEGKSSQVKIAGNT